MEALVLRRPFGGVALLKLIERAHGKNDQCEKVKRDGPVPFHSRTPAAEQAGLCGGKRKTALRMARIPEAEFEAAVQSETPPTVLERSAIRNHNVLTAEEMAELFGTNSTQPQKPERFL
jgi:hypothetical protein